jgi:prepilin-type N-terminal cleavage/methylation domain-containing protein
VRPPAGVSTRPPSAHPLTGPRLGYTLVEMAVAIVVASLLGLIAQQQVGPMIQRTQVNRATAAVAADLESAFSMAARQRRPIRISCCTAVGYTFADRSDGTVRLQRSLVDFGVTTLAFTASPVDIFPSGVASSADTVSIGAAGYTRRIVMTSAGLVRILP